MGECWEGLGGYGSGLGGVWGWSCGGEVLHKEDAKGINWMKGIRFTLYA